MQIKQQKNKKVALSIGVATLILIVLITIAWYLSLWPFHKTTSVAIDDTTQKTVNESPKNNNRQDKSDMRATPSETKTTNEVPVSKTMNAAITTLSQDSSNVTFAAKVTDAPEDGQCVVSFTSPNDRPVIKQFSSTANGSTVLCGPVTIPLSDFSYLGEWKVNFRYFTDNTQATADRAIVIK